MEQLSLLDAAQPLQRPSDAPRCRMCARPARWCVSTASYGPYCGIAGQRCNSRERLCQHCGREFLIGTDGAGTKYCSRECMTRRHGYVRRERERCAWCDRVNPDSVRRSPRPTWPYICATCIEPLRYVVVRLKDHHVPHERARQLLTDSACEVCGRDLLERVGQNGRGKAVPLLVVDHDHDCCPTDAHSCGRCVRGLICRYCNLAAGSLMDSADSARALAKYLDAWRNRAS
jgi:hypothetical protein